MISGAGKVHSLDLAGNFIVEFPATALKTFEELKFLNLSSNLIQVKVLNYTVRLLTSWLPDG